MRYEFTYEWAKNDLKQRVGDESKPYYARGWLYEFDDSEIEEGERLNIMLTVIMWETEHSCISEPVTDELYLYYEQLVKGELDNVIDPKERKEIVNDLTECFKKAFPEGLNKNG